ncbi:YARHG domain-containing protein [Aureibaculum algae]|uniref:YARHG domain-containing protein n=1 Tax=Aureibaculum algae TaxID=2584122 RepID=A0A5B7TNT6_9FLAO|nr:YARHG domain-containing protein [Aureibaculum algae]QCX37900.1 YARHG domain-containing protein [Aureibaculum algae]
MKNILVLIITITLTQSVFSQIENCSECDLKKYSEKDINHLTLLELKILRNEIFARHQYVFTDERLSDYFLNKYDWYKPNNKQLNNIELNHYEKENISLFSKKENEKINIKKTIIKELEIFLTSLNENDTSKINSVINKVTKDFNSEHKNVVVTELKDILTKINIKGIHWYNESGLYKIITDDGYFLNETSIKIKGEEIILSYNDMGHSELLSDKTAFDFGSSYDSTNEYASWYTFEIKNNKLILIKHQAAG